MCSTLTQVTSVFWFLFPWSTIGAQCGAKHSKLKLRCANVKVSYTYPTEDLEFNESKCSKIQNSMLPFWGRALVAAGAIVSNIKNTSAIKQLTGEQERSLKAQILAADWNGASWAKKRTPGVAGTLLMKVTITDASQASSTSRWMNCMRAMRNDPDLATLIWECRHHSLFRVQGCRPPEALLASQRLHLDWFGNTLVEINCRTVDLFKLDVQHFADELREVARQMSWSQTS